MPEAHRWRALLARIVQDPQEKQRIIQGLNINGITLQRWIGSDTRPRRQKLLQLVQILPHHRDELIPLLQEEFEDFTFEPIDLDEPVLQDEQEIPSVFYIRVLHDHCCLPRALRFTALCNLILLQALNHLDPHSMGIEITVALCMPPTEGNGSSRVRSLRESIGRGTPPWHRELEQRTLFLGNESLAGYVLTTGHFCVIQSREEGHELFPAHWVEEEESAMAYPIMYESRFAGCLLVSGTQPHYFTPFRQKLIQQYAELLVLTLDDAQFYDFSSIALAVMPSYQVQHSYVATFRQRVSRAMVEAAKQQQHLNLLHAENLVWQQIEAELLRLPHTM